MNKNILKVQSKGGLGNMQVFSYGNSKLPKSTLIVNITSALNCPSDFRRLCSCAKVCYARKCERIYKNYLNKNLSVENLMNVGSDDELKEMLEVYINSSPLRITHVRLNEAGDFPDQNSIERGNRLASGLLTKFDITTYCYTCREDLDFSNVNFIVNASTKNIKANRYFFCLDKLSYENLPSNAVKCKGDCNKCRICYTDNYKGVVYVKQH